MSDFTPKACSHCPYRKDVKPFLHPKRGEALAYAATNPYNTFHCHKTAEHADNDDNDSGEMLVTQRSKMCAGFLTLMHNELGETPYDHEGFEPDPNVYSESFEMQQAYQEQD